MRKVCPYSRLLASQLQQSVSHALVQSWQTIEALCNNPLGVVAPQQLDYGEVLYAVHVAVADARP